MLSFDQALEKLLSAAQGLDETCPLPLLAANGHVLAAAQRSTVAVPPLDNSAMDGYAVRTADIPTPGVSLPVSQRIPAGCVGSPLLAGTAARIFTGAPIPAGADAVVMQERCLAEGEQVNINHLPKVGENIRLAGEDICLDAEILPAGLRLRPQDIALAAAAGLPTLPVYRRLKVAVFFTGDELCQPGEPLPPGAIYNSNRYALGALLAGLNCEVCDLGTVPDTLEATRAALRQAAVDSDLIITSGGVSVGEEDHVKPAVEAEGRLDLWKIAIKPGKPLAFGEINRPGVLAKTETKVETTKAWFIGLPGNPVSAMVTFMMLVRPFILRLQGVQDVVPHVLNMRADFDWKKPDQRTEFLRARTNGSGGIELFPNQGAGVMTSLCWADGLVMNPPGASIAAGDTVRFIPFTELI